MNDSQNQGTTTRNEFQLGGSDAPILMGVSPYSTPFELWHYKTGLLERPQPSAYYIEAGNVMEPVIASWFARENDCRVRRRTAEIKHNEHDFIRGHIDRTIHTEGVGTGVLECKNTNEYLKARWGDEDEGANGVPDHVLIQLFHYMMTGDYAFGAVAALIGGNKFRSYFIERDERIEKALLETEVRFWNDHVLANVAPEVDHYHPSTLDFIKGKYSTVADPDDALGWDNVDLDRLQYLGEQHDRLKQRRDELMNPVEKVDETIKAIKSEVRHLLREIGSVTLNDGSRWVRKEVVRKPYEVKGSSYVSLSRKTA